MEQLRTLRLARGYSLDELSARIGGLVTKQMLSKYEKGQSQPSQPVAQALAATLGVNVVQLYEAPPFEFQFIAYRKHSGMSQAKQAGVQAALSEELSKRLDVQQRLGLTCEFKFERRQVRTQADIEEAAAQVRADWKLGEEPIDNLVDVLERKGVHVLEVEGAPEKFHGLSAVARTGRQFCGAMIAYRTLEAGERQRSTVAHELGHLKLEVAHEADLDEEKAVQSFASALFMPQALMFETLGRSRSNIQLTELLNWKAFFGCSIQAILYRARTLGIISDAYHREWMIFISTQGWRREEPKPLRLEEPQYWRQLVQRAVSERAITTEAANRMIPGVTPASEVKAVDRKAFLRLPPEERRKLLAQQAMDVAALYEPGSQHTEWTDDYTDTGLDDE